MEEGALRGRKGKASWPAVAAAVALNLIPVIGVLLWGWNAFALVFLYWLENLVIGARTLLSMLANAVIGGGLNYAGLLVFGAFFTLHYGLFCFVHGTFVVSLFGAGVVPGDTWLDLYGAAEALFRNQPNLFIGLASIVLWQGVQFVRFIAGGEAGRTNPLSLMIRPYPRIIVMHLTIFAGGFLLLAFNQPIAGLVGLALIKMAFDVAEAMGRGLHMGGGELSALSGPPARGG